VPGSLVGEVQLGLTGDSRGFSPDGGATVSRPPDRRVFSWRPGCGHQLVNRHNRGADLGQRRARVLPSRVAVRPSTPHLVGLPFSLRDWTNQALMAVFFPLVGVEIRREVSSGELGSWRRASVPVAAAALGGMIVPASIYAAVLHSSIGARGWEVPMATRRCVRYRSVGFCRRPDFCAPAGLPDDRSGHGRHRVDHHSRLLLEHPPRGAVPAARSHEYPCHGRNRGPAGLVRSAAGPRCLPAGSRWLGVAWNQR
jgi:hypothetical protein